MSNFDLKSLSVGAFIGVSLALSIGAAIQAEYIQKVEVSNLPLPITAALPLPVKEPLIVTHNANQWLYYVQTITPDSDDALNQVLKTRGTEAWELVGVRSNQFIFKKPVGTPPG